MKYSINDVAGVVVLYNSDADAVSNIASYYDQINKLFVIDNSEQPNNVLNQLVSEHFCNAHYEWNGGNKGVAYALNKAATLAIQEGYKFLLTMDDDSEVPQLMINKMISFWSANEDKKIGIVAASYREGTISEIPHNKPVLFTITSGNLLSLKAYENIGPFREDFFIDHVDHDYCLRLNQRGYSIIEMGDVNLKHQLGVRSKKKIGDINFIEHNPLRLYYFTRNGLILCKKWAFIYPSFLLFYLRALFKFLVKSLVFRNTSKRLFFFSKGLFDGLINKTGSLQS